MEGIIIAIADKLLPEIIKKFIPLVKVRPKNLKFIKSEWKETFNFLLYNIYKETLFDVYLLIDINNAKTDNFELSKDSTREDLKIGISDIEFNYEILRLNCIYENNKEFILLKIAQINPESFISFRITCNINCEVKLKVLKYSKSQTATLQKTDAGAVTFEIPLKSSQRIKMKSFNILLRKA